jgi:hypothetical protein
MSFPGLKCHHPNLKANGLEQRNRRQIDSSKDKGYQTPELSEKVKK